MCFSKAASSVASPAIFGASFSCTSACSSIEWMSPRYLMICSSIVRSFIETPFSAGLSLVPRAVRDQTRGSQRRSGLEDDLDRAVLLLLEHLVGLRRPLEREAVGCEIVHPERVLVRLEQRQDLVDPALYVRLAHPDLHAL